MEDIENKSNNELLFEVKQLQADHDALKIKLLKEYDKLEKIEERFDKIQKLLTRRLKGEV